MHGQQNSFKKTLLLWKSNYYIFCVCVSVALGKQHETRMRHIATCGLPRSTILSHIIS